MHIRLYICYDPEIRDSCLQILTLFYCNEIDWFEFNYRVQLHISVISRTNLQSRNICGRALTKREPVLHGTKEPFSSDCIATRPYQDTLIIILNGFSYSS